MARRDDGRIVLSRAEYIAKQKEAAQSGYNRWLAGEKMHKDPSPEEAMKHFIESGGAADFAEKYVMADTIETAGCP
ncbi:MAG: hypothetical protein MUC28_03320 [Planctomycetes bacterium]|nr:hypothetical protein [Planctomycetota bacterium]